MIAGIIPILLAQSAENKAPAVTVTDLSPETTKVLSEMIVKNTERALSAQHDAEQSRWLFWLAVIGGGAGLVKLWLDLRRTRNVDAQIWQNTIAKECETFFTSEEFERRREKTVRGMIREELNEEFKVRGPSFADANVVAGMQRQIDSHEAMFRENSTQLGQIQRQLGELTGLLRGLVGQKQ